MNYPKRKNELTLTVITFGFVGFMLLIGVIFFHQPINAQLTIAQDKNSSVVINVKPRNNPIPDELIREITQDERNILGCTSNSNSMLELLTPAMRFLHTISSNNLFLTQE